MAATSKENTLDRLVTYGTLMRAFGMHEKLGVADQLSFIAPCRFDGRLYDLGAYPGAVPGESTVQGELFRLEDPDVLDLLDQYEGYHPGQGAHCPFIRRRVTVGPMEEEAWVYWYTGAVDERPEVTSGSWVEYQRKNA